MSENELIKLVDDAFTNSLWELSCQDCGERLPATKESTACQACLIDAAEYLMEDR